MEPNLVSPSHVRALAERLGLQPSRVLGQNFLTDGNILRIILDAAELAGDEHVLEVGPGLGVLTVELVRRADHVTAIEKDERLTAYLGTCFAENSRLTLIQGDVLDCDWTTPAFRSVSKVVSNLPYSVASRFLVDLARLADPPARVVITVQREVAQRLTAGPGRDFGLLSLETQLAYEARDIKTVSPTCFWPRPEVRSSVVVMTRRSDRLPPPERAVVSRLAQRAFTQRRKQLGSSLARGEEVDRKSVV